jgi:hypothetical protein
MSENQQATIEVAKTVLDIEFNPSNIERRVGQYVMIRDKIKEMEERHKTELKGLKAIQEELTGILQASLEAVKAESIKTSEGTVYATTRYTASLADPKAFMDYVIANNHFDLLDRKANATAIRDYVAQCGELPPGANLSAISTIGVRRASK